MKKISIFLISILSLLVILDINLQLHLVGLILIIISHTFLTYKMVDHIYSIKDILSLNTFKYVGLIVLITALIKSTLGYYNGAFIINEFLGIDIEPIWARLYMIIIIVLLAVLPIWQKRHVKDR
jgi:hypothetical protein